MLNLYLTPFLLSFFVSVIFIFFINFFNQRRSIIKNNIREESRHLHKKNVSRWGGIAIVLSFYLVVFIDKNLVLTKDIWGILTGGLLIFIMGVWDDFMEINWKKQIIFQVLAVLLIFVFGVKIYTISNPFGGVIYLNSLIKILAVFLIAIIWSVVLMNAINWLDGIDGISMGISIIGLITVFILSLKPEVNQPPVGILSLVLAGSVLGFLTFNFPPAKIMPGSSGVFFVGFVIASLSIFAGVKVATTLLVLFIPLVDFFWVVSRRLISGRSIFVADQEHLHHKLIKIGWTQWEINLFFYAITILVAGVALVTNGLEKIMTMFLLVLLMLSFYWIINQKEKLIFKKIYEK